MLEYLLLPETKSAQTFRADVIVADTTASGLRPLHWYNRVCTLSPHRQSTDCIFVNEDGSPWTSLTYCQQFLYPCLSDLKATNDSYLLAGEIPSLFWSLHCYRRGAQTHVDRSSVERSHFRFQKSIKLMVYEHGHWNLCSSSLPIDIVYRDWSPRDRVFITLLFF